MNGVFVPHGMSDIINALAKQTDDILLEQLNELVKRGLLVVERGPMTLTTNKWASPEKIEVNQVVRLVLKDQAYIEKLEKENVEMKGLLDKLRTGVLNA